MGVSTVRGAIANGDAYAGCVTTLIRLIVARPLAHFIDVTGGNWQMKMTRFSGLTGECRKKGTREGQVDRKDIEREVRQILKDRHASIRDIEYDGDETHVVIEVKYRGRWFRGTGTTRYDPGDEGYNERVGYEIALDRAIRGLVEEIWNAEQAKRAKNEERRKEYEASLAQRRQDVARVRIVKCMMPGYWYRNRIGDVFEARQIPHFVNLWEVDDDGFVRSVEKEDCEVISTTPATPQRKQAVRVIDGLERWFVWCDDEDLQAVKDTPGIARIGALAHYDGSREMFFDPCYDIDEVVRAIESIGA